MSARPQRVRDVMSRVVKTLLRNDTLSVAQEVLAAGGFRHLVVLADDGAVAGVLSQRDLLRGALARAMGLGSVAQKKLMDMLLVKEVMSTEIVTVAPDASLEDAARRMIERKIGCLPVVEGDRLVGILTEGDFVRLFA
jgi:CBS domain-containing membrane protein